MAGSPVSPLTPLTLNGVSQYSSDLQSILNRAVQIAQIPVTALQNKDSDILTRETELSTISTAVAGLGGSLSELGTIAANQALSASSSDSSVVTASATGATTPATYTINSVTSAATLASERTQSSYADSTSTPVSSTGTMDLVVGTHDHVFTLTKNSLIGVRDTINALNAGVTASILTTPGGNYLSLTATSTGHTTLKLIDDPSTPSNPNGANLNILTSANQGTDAVFQLNGITVDQASNTVNSVIPGVTLNIVGQSNAPVTVTLSSDPSRISAALQSFVSGYNSLHDALNAEAGPAAGLLQGDPLVTQLESALRQVASYRASSGSVRSLADLGVTFDANGKVSLDPATVDSLSGQQLSDAFQFVGSATTGLAGFSQTFGQYTDPITGLIKIESDGFAQTDKSLQAQIGTLNTRINATQTALAARLQVVDSLIAHLQSQQQSLTASLQGLNLVLYGKNPNQAV
jgi:flagellar hook-associated protein 2